MKKQLIGLALAAMSACASEPAQEKQGMPTGEVIPVKVATVQQVPVSGQIQATGLLYTDQEARLGFKIGGVIERAYFTEGQSVKKGQLLASLKTAEIDAQLAQAQLGLEKAQRDFDRAKKLHADSVATLEQLQNAKTGLDVAKQTVDLVSFNKHYAHIYAPADGFVLKKLANEGEVIGAGMPVYAIGETGAAANWVLKVGVTDADWARISLNQLAHVSLNAFPNETFDGKVLRKSQAADPVSGTFQIEIQVALRGRQPAMGMFGRANINLGGEGNMPVIPYDAMMEANGNQAFVFVPEGNKVRKQHIRIHSFNQSQVLVAEGLQVGQRVVVSNSAFLNEKSQISIIEP